MRAMILALAAGALLTVPADAFAQSGRASGSARGRVEQTRDRDVYSRTRTDDRYERRDRRYDDYDRYDRRGKKNGPKFCQNGAGHPVHGRQWCRDKGYDVGRGYIRDRDVRWDRVRWEDVIFRRPDRRYDSRIGSSVLRDVLGGRVYDRLDGHRRSSGYPGGLTGSWSGSGNGYVLNVLSGGVPFAQLIDANRDGRAETVLLIRR